MSHNTQIDSKRVMKQLQGARHDPIPQGAVTTTQLNAGTRLDLQGAAAIVGSGADVTAGRATHISLATAIANTLDGDTILVLNVNLSENVTISGRRMIRGHGYDSQFTGTFTITGSFNTIKYLRFMGTLVLSGASAGNIATDCFFASAAIITDSGTGNVIDGVDLA